MQEKLENYLFLRIHVKIYIFRWRCFYSVRAACPKSKSAFLLGGTMISISKFCQKLSCCTSLHIWFWSRPSDNSFGVSGIFIFKFFFHQKWNNFLECVNKIPKGRKKHRIEWYMGGTKNAKLCSLLLKCFDKLNKNKNSATRNIRFQF